MQKRVMLMSSVMCGLMSLAGAVHAADGGHPIFATTVDFLDYCFYDHEGGDEIFPLEVYEKRLKACADAGIKKIYLRVNCLGLTLYPTKVSVMYGENGQFHWNSDVEAQRLIKTIRTYDVCEETIRICHKYGMEAWCWESLCDGGGRGYSDLPFNEKYAELHIRHRGNPFCDPFYVAHPEYYAWRDPKLMIPKAKLDSINKKAQKGLIGSILVVDSNATGKMPRIKPEEVEIYVSDDNMNFARYDKPFKCRMFVDDRKCSSVEISELSIPQRYVKLAHPTYGDKNWALAVRNANGDCKVFDTKGKEIFTTWNNIFQAGAQKERGGLNFAKFEPAGWDYTHYMTGFMRGMADDEPIRYFAGTYEFNCPQAMEHQLARFKELAAYPFDGFMMNYRTHSRSLHPEEYGYNPEVRKIYKKKYDVDIWKKPADPIKFNAIRADGIARFLAGCKSLIGKRPLFITGLKPVPPGEKAPTCGKLGDNLEQIATRGMSLDMFAHIPWPYKRLIAEDKSVDGVMMTSAYFPEAFTPEITGGRKITVGLYRERPSDRGAYDESKYDFKADMERLWTNPNIDEVELYEALDYTNCAPGKERLPVLKAITGGKK